MPILTCIFFTFNWLTLTSEMHFVKFHPEVASCLLSRGKRKYAPLGMRLLWKYIRNYFLVYQLISRFLLYLQNYKEFEAEILNLQSEKYGLSFDIKKYTTSGWALGDENVIGIRACDATTNISTSLKILSHKVVQKSPPYLYLPLAYFTSTNSIHDTSPMGVLHPYQKLACFVLYLKIINTYL